MKSYFFIPAILEQIRRADFFSRVCAWGVRLFAVLFALGALIGWFQIWKAVFDMNGAAILGGVLFQICFAAGAYMVLHVLWLRAGDMKALGAAKDFAIIPAVPIFFSMLGEIYASLAVAFGAGKGLLQLFVDHTRLADRTMSTIPGIGWEHSLLVQMLGGSNGISSFLNAILFAVGGVISAVLWLVMFYLLAEITSLVLNAARDLRALREKA